MHETFTKEENPDKFKSIEKQLKKNTKKGTSIHVIYVESGSVGL